MDQTTYKDSAENHFEPDSRVNGNSVKGSRRKAVPKAFAIHSHAKESLLSKDSNVPVSYRGFRNLAALLLTLNIVREVMENFRTHGLVIADLGYLPWKNIEVLLLTYILVIPHIPLALLIERINCISASKEKKQFQMSKKLDQNVNTNTDDLPWTFQSISVLIAHIINIIGAFSIASYITWNYIQQPFIGMFAMINSMVVCLKLSSYALTNSDLKQSYILSQPVPALFLQNPYPSNLTFGNLFYFMVVPTLVYQPKYPQTTKFRLEFWIKRALEMIMSLIAIYIVSVQFALPIMNNYVSVSYTDSYMKAVLNLLDWTLRLSSVSLLVWLIGFFAVFHSFLNAVAEVTYFAGKCIHFCLLPTNKLQKENFI